MTAARGTAGYKLGFAVEDDDKAASVGLEALDLLGRRYRPGGRVPWRNVAWCYLVSVVESRGN